MNILGLQHSNCIALPEQLENRIIIRRYCKLEQNEDLFFQIALDCFAKYLSINGDPHPSTYVTAVFADDDTVILTPSEQDMANYDPMVFYWMHQMRRNNYGNFQLLAAYLEELCHGLLLDNPKQDSPSTNISESGKRLMSIFDSLPIEAQNMLMFTAEAYQKQFSKEDAK